MITSYINHFRPIYEFRAAAFWLAAIVILPLSGMPYAWAFVLVAGAFFAVRAFQIWRASS